MRILIGADLVPIERNIEYFKKGDAEHLLGTELKRLLSNADYRIFNLEVPLTDEEAPIPKCGPNLIAPTETVNGLKAMGVNILTLANNHILDHGEQGLISTCEILEKNGITYLGVGANPTEAAKPYIFECDNKKIGIYACAEHEFSIVTEHSAGANPFDPLESLDHVAELKAKCDFVIVLYHGGKEHYRYPSPNLQKVCRKLVEKGAGLVICQHTHCIGCEERYKNGTIVYGQGNFLFDHSESEFWQTSLLVQLGENFEISYIPLVKQNECVRLADGDMALKILADFEARSRAVREDGFIENRYTEFARSMLNEYLFNIFGIRRGFIFKVINKLSGYRFGNWLLKRKYKKQTLLKVENYIKCEAHREVLLKGIFIKRNYFL